MLMELSRPAPLGSAKQLAGRVAVVTGSTSGIGLGIARALAEAGAAVVLNGLGNARRHRRDRRRARGRVRRAGDLFAGRHDEARRDRAHGRPDARDLRAARHPRQQCRHPACRADRPVPGREVGRVIAINLSSAFHTTRLALPAMRKQGCGRIINVASAHGLVASPFKSAYVAAKHGIVGLTKVTALETAEDGITCNAICPGYVWTPLVEAQIDGQAKSHGIPREEVIRDVLLAHQPNKRFATVEEIGALAVFLASDAAASITGTALPVDGGWTAH